MANKRKSHRKTQSTPAAKESTWQRVKISGELITKTALHIGSGEEELRGITNQIGDTELHRVNVLLRDARGEPYIPGSTLRGFLRRQFSDHTIRDRLFGSARQPADSDAHGNAGALRVYDAALRTTSPLLQCTTRNSIDNLTGTTREHHLSNHEEVPAQSIFDVDIWFDSRGPDISSNDIAAILSALARLSSDGIGKSKSIGLGQLIWKTHRIEGLTSSSIKSWLRKEIRSFNDNRAPKEGPLQRWNKSFSTIRTPAVNESYLLSPLWTPLSLKLTATSQVLVGGFANIIEDEDQSVKAPQLEAKAPQLEAQKRGNVAVIPGSTLKGWFRAHSRRILMTLTQGEHEHQIDDALGEMFGSLTSGQSTLRFYDARCPQADMVRRYFNAVDRFSGGVKDTALFSAEAVQRGSVFCADLSYHRTALRGWMKLLLFFVVHDALAGDLVLGWGKARGLGELQLALDTDTTPDWLSIIDASRLRSWEEDLHHRIGLQQRAVS